jgi:hypothetical protein
MLRPLCRVTLQAPESFEHHEIMAASVEQTFDGIRVSRADWPIVVTEFPEKRVSDEALHAMLGHLEELLNEAAGRNEKLYFVTDLTVTREIPPANQRKVTSQWMARTATLAKTASLGAAQVTPSAILRGIFTAVFWLHPSPMPSIFVATRREAMIRGVELLEAAGALLPPRLMAFRETGRRASGDR